MPARPHRSHRRLSSLLSAGGMRGAQDEKSCGHRSHDSFLSLGSGGTYGSMSTVSVTRSTGIAARRLASRTRSTSRPRRRESTPRRRRGRSRAGSGSGFPRASSRPLSCGLSWLPSRGCWSVSWVGRALRGTGARPGLGAGNSRGNAEIPRFCDSYSRKWRAQLGAGPDAELPVDPARVVIDRAVGHVELRGHLVVRPSLGHERGDALLRRGQLVARGWASTDAGELRPRLFRPECGTELVEDRERLAEAFAGCSLLLGPALRRPEGEEGACSLERIRDARMLRKRPLELGESCVVISARGG